MSFQPSPYSGLNGGFAASERPDAYDQAAKADALSSGISAVGALGVTAMQMGFAVSSQRSQQKHEQKLAKQQEKLIALQTEQSLAQGAADRAAAAVASLGTTKTLLVVGGVLMTVGLIAAAVVAVKRSGNDDYEYEDEYE